MPLSVTKLQSLNCTSCASLFSCVYNSQSQASKSSEREMLQATAASSSSRWRPTSEQLLTLEKLYANGVRPPDASQIHQITAHLSCYGKVEGKNVFYWFQNHKARERQKLRKSLINSMDQAAASPLLHCHFTHPSQFLIHQDDATLKEELNLLCKLGSRSGEDEVITHNEQEWMAMMDADQSSSSSSTTTTTTTTTFYGKPALETLYLFPTKRTHGRLNN